MNANPTKNAGTLSVLAMIDAALGRKDEAVREARLACEKMPETQGGSNGGLPALPPGGGVCLDGPNRPGDWPSWNRGPSSRPDADLIYQPTYGDLKLNPMWDPLRGDPRFDALVETALAPPEVKRNRLEIAGFAGPWDAVG